MAEGTPSDPTLRHPGESRDPVETSAMDSGLRRSGDEGMTALSSASLHKLMAWLSPAFPVGGFSYSHGLEWAIEDGTVTTAAALEQWLTAILRHGAGRTDAIFFCHAHRARPAMLPSLVELAAAFQPTKERHLETVSQGRAFLSAVNAAWPNDSLAAAMTTIGSDAVPYAVAVAVAAAAHDVPLSAALSATLTAFAANIVSAGVRAIPIGQTEGQRIIAALSPIIVEAAAAAQTASLDDLGGAVLRADIASMKHETQYTRLFRS